MEPNAYRDEDLEAYWRRRVILLAGGLVVLGILAWALSGSGGGKPPRQPILTMTGLPAAAYGTATPDAVAAPAFAAGSTSAFPGVASPTSGTPGRQTPSPRPVRPHGAPRRASRQPAGGWCPPGSLVMSLYTGKPSYPSRAWPVFSVYAVSTASPACRMRFGPGAVRVIVSRHGRVVWNSAECARSTEHIARLSRGVPVQMSVTWNRRAGYGCRGWLPVGTYGRFSAVARASGAFSSTTYFELVR